MNNELDHTRHKNDNKGETIKLEQYTVCNSLKSAS